MAASTKELQYKIGADFGEVRREAQRTGDATKKFLRELDQLERRQREHRATMESLGRGFMTFGAAMVAGLGLAAKAAMDWETAFTGVRKTVDGSDQEIAALEKELRGLTRTLPSTHKEIAAVAEAAGQLGIKREDIAGFTKVMIDLGQTTNLSAEEAATSLAKFSNIMGVSAKDVDKLGSALVALGNDGASTEADIMEMGLRIAGAGRTVGLTADQVLSLASALSSVGINAEAGGSAISRVMVSMATAVKQGGKELDDFAKVAGMTGADFRKEFETNAAGALQVFIRGLGQMQAQGKDVFGTLEQLGLSDIRVQDTMLRAAGAVGVFSAALATGSKGWIENTALAEEANKRYATSAARMAVAGNQIKDALIDVGAVVLPVVGKVVQGGSDIARAFQNLPGPLKDVSTVVATVVGGFSLIGGAALLVGPKILDFRDKMGSMVATGGGFSKALGKFGMFMTGPWGAAIGLGATLLGTFAAATGAAQRRQDDLASAGKTVAQALREQNGVITESVRQTAAKAAADAGILKMADDLGVKLPLITDAILGQGDAYKTLMGQLDEVIRKRNEMKAERGGDYGYKEDEQINKVVELRDALATLIGGKNADVEASKNVAEASKESADSMKGFGEQTATTAEETEKAADALNEMISAMDKMDNSTLNAREAERQYVEQLEETAEVLKKNGAGLDVNTKAGRENAAALDAQATKAREFAKGVAAQAEQLGGAASGAAALKSSLEASRPALIAQAEAFGMDATKAAEYADRVLAIPKTAETLITTPGSGASLAELARVQGAVKGIPADKQINVGVLSEVAQQKLADLGYKVQRLPNGTVTVTGNTGPAESKLNSLIAYYQNRVIYMRTQINDSYIPGRGGKYYEAHGGIVSFASGGFYGEQHTPQIARAQAGLVRVWAEPETGRESYIPWAPARRAAATDVLRATAAGFGYELMPRAASVGSGVMATGAAGSGNTLVAFQTDGTRIGDLLVEMLRKTIRVQGGNVQTVLGSA